MKNNFDGVTESQFMGMREVFNKLMSGIDEALNLPKLTEEQVAEMYPELPVSVRNAVVNFEIPETDLELRSLLQGLEKLPNEDFTF